MKQKLEKYSKIISNRLKQYSSELTNVKVTSAHPLKEEQLAKLKKALEHKYGSNLNLILSVDSSLIGGISIEVNSQVFDSSLKTKLNQIINPNEKEGV